VARDFNRVGSHLGRGNTLHNLRLRDFQLAGAADGKSSACDHSHGGHDHDYGHGDILDSLAFGLVPNTERSAGCFWDKADINRWPKLWMNLPLRLPGDELGQLYCRTLILGAGMRRREFIIGPVDVAASCPLAAFAQPISERENARGLMVESNDGELER
jgi:hypothetical protein